MTRRCTTRRRKTEAALIRRRKRAQRSGWLFIRFACEPWAAFERMSEEQRDRLVYL